MTGIPQAYVPLLVLAAVWVIPWKGYALWKSARLNQPWWFIALLVINTLGLLEILYIFVFSKMKPGTKTEPPTPAGSGT